MTTPMMRTAILSARRAGTVGAAVGLLVCLTFGASAKAELKLPPVDEVLKDLNFTAEDLQRAKEGKFVEKKMSEGSKRELSIGFALLTKAKPEDVAKMYREARDLETVKVIKSHARIAGNGTMADFEKVVLQPNPEKEAQRYLDAEPGDTLNLDEKEIAAFQALKSASKGKAVPVKEVEQLVRQGLLARLQAYRTKGLAGIAPYQRSKDSRVSAADELRLATKQSVALAKYVPALHDVLMNYPAAKEKVKNERFEESFYWFNLELFDRPTFVLAHRVSMFADYAYVAVERQFYTSHDYNAMQQITAAVQTKDGTLMFYIGRVSTDQVAGFTSVAAHPAARTIMAPYIKEMFEAIRSRVETK
ncbi:MAG: hypothetical protein ACREIS_04890 [Nitrospiraceae bacterium]